MQLGQVIVGSIIDIDGHCSINPHSFTFTNAMGSQISSLLLVTDAFDDSDQCIAIYSGKRLHDEIIVIQDDAIPISRKKYQTNAHYPPIIDYFDSEAELGVCLPTKRPIASHHPARPIFPVHSSSIMDNAQVIMKNGVQHIATTNNTQSEHKSTASRSVLISGNVCIESSDKTNNGSLKLALNNDSAQYSKEHFPDSIINSKHSRKHHAAQKLVNNIAQNAKDIPENTLASQDSSNSIVEKLFTVDSVKSKLLPKALTVNSVEDSDATEDESESDTEQIPDTKLPNAQETLRNTTKTKRNVISKEDASGTVIIVSSADGSDSDSSSSSNDSKETPNAETSKAESKSLDPAPNDSDSDSSDDSMEIGNNFVVAASLPIIPVAKSSSSSSSDESDSSRSPAITGKASDGGGLAESNQGNDHNIAGTVTEVGNTHLDGNTNKIQASSTALVIEEIMSDDDEEDNSSDGSSATTDSSAAKAIKELEPILEAYANQQSNIALNSPSQRSKPLESEPPSQETVDRPLTRNALQKLNKQSNVASTPGREQRSILSRKSSQQHHRLSAMADDPDFVERSQTPIGRTCSSNRFDSSTDEDVSQDEMQKTKSMKKDAESEDSESAVSEKEVIPRYTTGKKRPRRRGSMKVAVRDGLNNINVSS